MGYTHYWEFKAPKRGQALKVEKAYQRAIKDCTKVVQAWQATANDWDRLSGYTAHAKAGAYGGLHVNGKGSEAHEDFTLREHFKQNFDNFGKGFAFCKTARKAYDTVVVACLAILKYHLKDNIEVSSDGDALDWIEGVHYAQRKINANIGTPKGIRMPPDDSVHVDCPNCKAKVKVNV